MKKTSILTLAASALLLTGCADEFGGLGGGKETVTFTTVLPTQVTRAYGDNISADKLFCFLYQDGKFVEAANPVTISGNTATVQMQLAKGVKYDVVFWAAKESNTTLVVPATAETATDLTTTTPYTYVEASGELKVDYSKIAANDPSVDAYYSKTTYTAGGTAPEAITLYRPFAQVNVGANDTQHVSIQKAYNGNIYSNIEFDAWTCMNLLGGEVDMNTQTKVATTIAKIPGDTESYPVEPEKNKYTNMAYILVPQATSSTINFKCNFYTSTEENSKKVTRDISNMPVQKNYRTNVYGALLTSTTDFKVEIAPAFYTPDFNNPKPSVSADNAEKINNLFANGKNPGAEIDIKVTLPITQAVSIPDQKTPTTVNLNLNGNALTEGITVGDKVILNVVNETPAAPALVKRRVSRGTTVENYNTKIIFTANTGATINIYNGEYKTNTCGVALANGGTINIYGGRFLTKGQTNPWGTKVVNTANGGKVNVVGGDFRYAEEGTYSLAQLGITPNSECKVTPHCDADTERDEGIAVTTVWQRVERVWHPGVDIASLEWETVGTGTFRDAWFRPCFKAANDWWGEYGENWDWQNLCDLTVTIKRCKTYPTLYMIENPYADVYKDWVKGTDPERPTYMDDLVDDYNLNGTGAIIFDLHNTSCVPILPGVPSGITGWSNSGDKMNAYNLEGAAYYNHRNCANGSAHSLEMFSYFNDYNFGGRNLISFKNDLTRYDKASRKLLIRNILVDATESLPGKEDKYFDLPMGHGQETWQELCQGYLIFPENFVLLDVYGNPVK